MNLMKFTDSNLIKSKVSRNLQPFSEEVYEQPYLDLVKKDPRNLVSESCSVNTSKLCSSEAISQLKEELLRP